MAQSFDLAQAPADYWFTALAPEVEAIWGRHRVWGNIQHTREMCWMLAINSFLGETRDDYSRRRELLYQSLRGPFSTTSPDDPLNVHRGRLPIESFIPKALNALCTAYRDNPSRQWLVNGEEDERVSKEFGRIYGEAGANGALHRAHRKVKLCGGGFIRPLFNWRGEMSFEILTPDQCRYTADPRYPDKIEEIAIPLQMDIGGKMQTVFECWHDDYIEYQDYAGQPIRIAIDTPDGVVMTDSRPNPYGRIPWETLRLSAPDTAETFGGGMWALVHGNILCNAIDWYADNSAMMESWGHWVAINLGFTRSPSAKLGPGRMTALDDVAGGEDGSAPPSLDYVATSGQYEALHQTKQQRKADILKGLGLPDSVVSGTQQPLSGIARVLERLELSEMREEDVLHLTPFETAFARLVARVYNTDYAIPQGLPLLPEAELETRVQWGGEPIYLDPKDRRALNVEAAKEGWISPAKFLLDEGGVSASDDLEAISIIKHNREMFALLTEPVEQAESAPLDNEEPKP